MPLLSTQMLQDFSSFSISVSCFSSCFTDCCQWHGHSIFFFFFFLPVAGFTLGPSQSCYCQKIYISHFHLQHPFSHHFQFLKLLFHFGFHRNHMSLLTNIFNAFPLTASLLISHDDSNVCKTPSF